MWEWLYQECNKLMKQYNMPKEVKDDIIQELLVNLFDNPDIAENIYIKRQAEGISILKGQIKCAILLHNAPTYFDNFRDYASYRRVLSVCQKYHINPTADNAYKIAPLMERTDRCNTITAIERLLSLVKPSVLSLDELNDNGVGVAIYE